MTAMTTHDDDDDVATKTRETQIKRLASLLNEHNALKTKLNDLRAEVRDLRRFIAEAGDLAASWRQPVGSSICAPVRSACADQLEALVRRVMTS